MTENQALEEWERLTDVAPAEEPSEQAKRLAAVLVGKISLIAREKDKAEKEEFDAIEYDDDEEAPQIIPILDLVSKHKAFWIRTLAKRYQTLIDEGKI